MNKSILRKKYIELRKQIFDKELKSKEICRRLIKSDEYQSARVVGLYYSYESEVYTLDLIRYGLSDNKRILLPKVVGNELIFYEINSLDNLVKSSFGIMEPSGGVPIDKNNIDLIVVPGVCFDRDLNRIGFGKGYYDRYLADYYGPTIGICFEDQISDETILGEETDIKLQYIITEKNIYS